MAIFRSFLSLSDHLFGSPKSFKTVRSLECSSQISKTFLERKVTMAICRYICLYVIICFVLELFAEMCSKLL